MFKHTCKKCGIDFNSKSSKASFCSMKCYGRNRQRVTKTCRVCGDAFEVRPFESGVVHRCESCRKLSHSSYQHGDVNKPLYWVWHGMRSRCMYSSGKSYKNYGGRGIAVCEEWQAYIPFRDWAIANGYAEGLTIDRIDNDKGYFAENCRWVTRRTQVLNRRKRRDSRSRFKGVGFASKRSFTATINVAYKSQYLGSFKTELEAALAYDDAAHEAFGVDATLNFPERKRVVQ